MIFLTIIFTIILGLLGLGVIVFIHESGHFIAAKACGVEVETFSLGWGKKIFGFKYKNTNYQISWIPIGGYCKMKGEMQTPTQIEESDFKELLKIPGSYLAASWWKKVLISASGPLFNLLFAIFIFTITTYSGFTILSEENKIIIAESSNISPAIQAGLKTGDIIIEANNQKIEYFDEFASIIRKNPNKKLFLKVKRDNSILYITIIPELNKMIGRIGVYGWSDPIIKNIDKGFIAEKADLKIGDRILLINELPIKNQIDIYNSLQNKPDQITLKIKRENSILEKILDHITYDKNGNPNLGMNFYNKYRSPKMSLGQAFLNSLQEVFEIFQLTINGFIYLFTAKQENLKDTVAGPIRITQMVGEITIFGFNLSFNDGISSFFRFICLLSVIIAFMNILPIPALDGGQILLSLLMLIFHKKIGIKFIYRYQIIGFIIVFLLLTFALFSDILNIFS